MSEGAVGTTKRLAGATTGYLRTMQPQLPPPDPNERLGPSSEPDIGVAAPTAVFMAGPPSPESDRIADAVLDFRPGLLFVTAAD